MTREEAYTILREGLANAPSEHHWCVAFNMAIKALEQEPCEDWYDVPSDEMTLEQARQAVKDLRKMWAEHLEQEPCDDAISRQVVLDLCKRFDGCVPYSVLSSYDMLPSVTLQPKIGHWIKTIEQDDAEPFILWKCSECLTVQRLKTNYCPNCGAKMAKSQESEVEE